MRPLLVGAALHPDLREPVLPRLRGRVPGGVEGAAALGGEVLRRAGRAGPRQRGDRLDVLVLGGVEPDVGAAAPGGGRGAAAGGHGGAVPGPVGQERAVEAGLGVERVRLGVLAEAAAGDGGEHGVVVQHGHGAGGDLVQRLAGVEQHVGLVGRREGVALPAGPRGGGQLRGDAAAELDLVVAGRRALVAWLKVAAYAASSVEVMSPVVGSTGRSPPSPQPTPDRWSALKPRMWFWS